MKSLCFAHDEAIMLQFVHHIAQGPAGVDGIRGELGHSGHKGDKGLIGSRGDPGTKGSRVSAVVLLSFWNDVYIPWFYSLVNCRMEPKFCIYF